MTGILLGLTGRAGSGKDAFATALGYERVAFADALKTAALATDPLIDGCEADEPAGGRGGFRTIRLTQLVNLHGWDEAKRLYPDVRRYLQNLGVAMRDVSPGIWVNIARERIADHLYAGCNIVVTDVRFADEVTAIQDMGGVIARIVRPGLDDLAGDAGRHVSESNVDTLPHDFIVRNDGNLYDLKWKAITLHDSLTSKENPAA